MSDEDLTRNCNNKFAEQSAKNMISSDEITKVTGSFCQLSFIDCQKSTETRDSDGILWLGYCYEHGIDVEKDEYKAFVYYQKSADMDNSNGMYQVGYCYYLGIGVEINKHKAFIYYQMSAKMGNMNGIFKTAICYLHGIGVEKNIDEFWEWIIKDPLTIDGYRIHVGGTIIRAPRNSSANSLRIIDHVRKSDYEKCTHCNEFNTNRAWCQTCDPDIATKGWTSRNKDIDDCVKAFQLRAISYERVIEWIPFDRLDNIEIIGVGGFGSVFSATWLDGIRKIDDNKRSEYKRSHKRSSTVALKTMGDSKTILNEFKNHAHCLLYGMGLKVYGLTYNTETDEYFMVFQFAEDGNIHSVLKSKFSELTWKFKLNQLKNISYELYRIHLAGYIHADLHSGNILHNKGISYITDLGLSRNKYENIPENVVYGVMPYVAPEVLSGKQLTQKADIYSLGIIMAEITTGRRPFDGKPFDIGLAVLICNGLRPEFASGTPSCYIELAEQCMNSDPQKRPNAIDINKKINNWLSLDNESEIKKQFLDADKLAKTLPIILSNHPNYMYTSKIINTQKVADAIKVSKLIETEVPFD